MRILNWVQSKFNGRHEKKKADPMIGGSSGHHNAPDIPKEEFSDWPHGLLTIGTLGNNEMNGGKLGSNELNGGKLGNFDLNGEMLSNTELNGESLRHESSDSSCSTQDIPDFTAEELNKLQNALTKLLSRKSKSSFRESEKRAKDDNNKNNLPLDRFLNCPSSLEIDRRVCQKFCDDLDNGDVGDVSPDTKIILNRVKDVLGDNRNAIQHRKSFSFLLKKMFVCKGGFAPARSLRDPLPESRMEKILKAILHKKIYPQSSARSSMKKCLEKGPTDEKDIEDNVQGKGGDGCKWVKTDSEYIVLEI